MHDVIIFHQTIATNDDRWLGWDREGLCLADRATNEFTPIMPVSVARDIMADRPMKVRTAN